MNRGPAHVAPHRRTFVSVAGKSGPYCRRATPGPAPSSRARPVTGLRTDGGSSFAVWSDLETWHPFFRGIVEAALAWQQRRDNAERWDDDVEPPDVQLPLPALPSDANSIGLAGVLDPDAVDWRLRGFGGDFGFPLASVEVSRGGRCIVLHFRNRAYVTLGRRMEKSTRRVRWYCHVQAKHAELYGRDLGPWMVTWLGYFSWLLFGQWTPPHELRSRWGWTTTQWHLNADFVGLQFDARDSRYFVGVRGRDVMGHNVEDDDEGDDDGEGPDDDEDAPGWEQTFNFGRKTSDVFVRGYKKGDEIREVKNLRPESSAFAGLWRLHGWDPRLDGDPFRVEFVFRKKGLVYRRKVGEEVLYDFRDPALLLVDEARRELWAYATTKRRLVDGQARRARECETDPRWAVVQSAAERPARVDMRQMPHGVVEMLQHERATRDERGLLDALQSWAMDEHNTVLVEPSDFIAAARIWAETRAREVVEGRWNRDSLGVDDDGTPTLVFGRDIFPTPWRSREVARRKVHRVQFFHALIIDKHEAFAEALRSHGGTGGCTTLELLGAPRVLEDAS